MTFIGAPFTPEVPVHAAVRKAIGKTGGAEVVVHLTRRRVDHCVVSWSRRRSNSARYIACMRSKCRTSSMTSSPL